MRADNDDTSFNVEAASLMVAALEAAQRSQGAVRDFVEEEDRELARKLLEAARALLA